MGRVRELFRSRPILSWALYDWANSVFATTVIAGFFPVFFKQYWNARRGPRRQHRAARIRKFRCERVHPDRGADPRRACRRRGIAQAVPRCVHGARNRGVGPDSGSSEREDWSSAAYRVRPRLDRLLRRDRVLRRPPRVRESAFPIRRSLRFPASPSAYIGGGLLFAVNVAMTLSPDTFGLSGAAEAVRLSFLTVAAWWLVFSIPLFRNVSEPPPVDAAGSAAAVGLRSLVKTLREYRTHRMAGLFLLAYFFYIDGGPHHHSHGGSTTACPLGFPSDSLIVALLIVQFVGFPAALVYGLVAGRVGPKPAIYFGVAGVRGGSRCGPTS